MTPKRRALTPGQKVMVIKRQNGLCACKCGESLGEDPRDIEFDHALALHLGGTNDLENFRAVKKRHHLDKTTREAKARAKADRIRRREGLMKRRLSNADKALAKALERT